jgi:hypothetical protein
MVIPHPARCQSLSMEYSIGFNDQFKLNSWTPITVTLENRGRPVSGSLEIVVTSGSEYQQDVYTSSYAQDVELPTNSKKIYTFTVLIKTATHDLLLKLSRPEKTLISKSVNLRRYYTEKSLAVVADKFVAPDILSALPESLHPVNIPPKFLPATWYGYDGVKLLIMRADTIKGLRPGQYRALIHWVKQGGFLLTSGGLNYGALFDKRVQNLLSLRVEGLKQLSEIASLTQFCSRPLADIKPFLVLNVRLDDASVLVEEDNIPIIAVKQYAQGKIVFVSFDYNAPPFSRWDGRTLFWDKILTLQPSAAKAAIDVDDQKIIDSMSASIPVRFPGFKPVIVFVVAYLVCLRLCLKRVREPGKTRWKYSLALLGTITFFTAAGFLGFFYPAHRQTVTYNSFGYLNLSDRMPAGSLKFIVGIYSIKNAAFQLDFGQRLNPVTPILSERSRRKIPVLYVMHEKNGSHQIEGTLNRWSHSFYKMESNLMAQIEGHAKRDNRRLTVRVDNKMAHRITNCLVYFKKRFVFVDDIPAQKRLTLKLELSDLKKTEIFNNHETNRIIDDLIKKGASNYLKASQEIITEDALPKIHAKYKSASDRLVILGWIRAGMHPPGFEQNQVKGDNLTLICWELPVEKVL